MADTSFTQQLIMSNLSVNSQIMQSTFSVASNINSSQSKNNTSDISSLTVTNSLGKLAYAVEGDSKYKEEIDTDDDGIITYNEYVKYVTESMTSKYNIPKSNTVFKNGTDSLTGLNKFTVTNISKVLSDYINNYVQLPTGIIEKET